MKSPFLTIYRAMELHRHLKACKKKYAHCDHRVADLTADIDDLEKKMIDMVPGVILFHISVMKDKLKHGIR